MFDDTTNVRVGRLSLKTFPFFDGIGLAGQNLVLKKYWNRSFCLFVVRIVLICIDDE